LATISNEVPHIVSYVAENGEFTDGNDDNGVVFQFRRSIKSRSDKNFMRFGRPDEDFAGIDDEMEKRASKNLMRFGKKDDRNMMRFGRSDRNLLRFGRSRSDNDRNKLRFGRSDKNFMRFGRDPNNVKRLYNQEKNLMRFGRNDPSLVEEINDYNDANDYDDFVDIPAERQPTPEKYDEYGKKILRLGKRRSQNLLRFGRANGNLLRFGRSNGNFMRFGRSPVTANVVCVDDNCMLEENGSNQKIGSNQDEMTKYEKLTAPKNDEKPASKDLSDLFGNNMDEPLLRPDPDDFNENKGSK
jgi:hypothetical protein